MTGWFQVWLRVFTCALTAIMAGCAPAMSVMSLNVRYPNPDDAQTWEMRRPVMVRMIARTQPDVIGTQELFARQGDDLVRLLPQYRWIGRDRYGSHADEHMAIFYNTKRLILEQHGDFWLSQTPDQPGSQSWGTNLPRMVTWARFRLRSHPGRRFIILNTHFPHREEDDAARILAAEVLVTQLARISDGAPVVLTADLNATPGSDAHAVLERVLCDVRPKPTKTRDDGTFHDFTGKSQGRLDYIMARQFPGSYSRILRDQLNGIYPSDHFALIAKLVYGSSAGPSGLCRD